LTQQNKKEQAATLETERLFPEHRVGILVKIYFVFW